MKNIYYSLFIILGTTTLMISCSNEETNGTATINNRPSIPVIASEVQIGTQTWTAQNLNVSRYRNGDPIPQVTDPVQWRNLTTGAWCYYLNNTANGTVYGKLYNWYAVDDSRGLSPTGWHVPSDAEWTTFTSFLGGEPIAGGKLKEIGTTHWVSPNNNATNSSGFSSLPAGDRDLFGASINTGYYTYYWTSSENDAFDGLARTVTSSGGTVFRFHNQKVFGFSVRCVKN